LLTDGRPTDESGRESDQLWPDARAAVLDRPRGEVKPSAIVAVGCGPNVDGETLNEIAFMLPTENNKNAKLPAFVMGRDPEDFVGFFQWLYITMRNTARAGGAPTLAQQAGSMQTTGDPGAGAQSRGSQPDL